MKIRTLRLRMMLLFCTVVGVLLAASYLAFWGLLARAVHTQINRQLLEPARPIIADMASPPNAKDINRLNLPAALLPLPDQTGHLPPQPVHPPAPPQLNPPNAAPSQP